MSAPHDPRVLLVYPPDQSMPDYMCKPNGSLAFPCLAAALLEHGVEVAIFDACVGNDRDDLQATFYTATALPSGLLRTGVSDARILEEVADYDVVGLTSIFTAQETMVLYTARLIKQHYPDKLVVAGGVNARSRLPQFFAAGIDAVFLSEAERTICRMIDALRAGSRDFRHISGLAVAHEGQIHTHPTRPEDVVVDLDTLPIPAWHLLPLQRYWTIARPHGGHFKPGEEIRYAQMMTSLGCVFACSYCHISGETKDGLSGSIGAFRVKSEQRVLEELQVLKDLGVQHVFISDDTLFGRKPRAKRIFEQVQRLGLHLSDVNGLNLVHLYKRVGNQYVPDLDLIDVLTQAGFKEIVLAFESGSQRVLKKYVSNKWVIDRYDVGALLAVLKARGFRVIANYMLGYPDETPAELQATVDLAKLHRSQGLDVANFLCVMPLPGTTLFDWALRDGHIDADFDPDMMCWHKATMRNTILPAAEVEALRERLWQEVNDPDYVAYKKGMRPVEATRGEGAL